MIIRLDLEKTYGQQNEDIAKKNKYDAVNMTVIDNYDKSYSDDITTLEEPITNTDNQNIRKNAILEEEWTHGFWAWETCKVKNPTYLIEVMYKNYSISISKSEYPELSQMRAIPTHKMYYDGDIYKEKSNQSFAISSIYDFDDFKNYFDNLTLEGPLFSEITPITNNYTISKNMYTITSEDGESSIETNIIDEISDILQQGVKQTNTPNLTDMLNYVNAKITSLKNTTDNVIFNVQCPYKIRVYQSDDCGCLDRIGWEGRYYGQVNSYNFNEYTISKLYINIYTEIQPETETRKFFSGSREYSANSSFLFTEDINYPQYFAQQVYDAYNKGKLILNINYPVMKLYDIYNFPIVYIEGVGIARKINDNYYDDSGELVSMSNNPKVLYNVPLEEGYLCQIYKDGSSEYLNSDGSIKNFLIQSQSITYTGVLINELKLIESMKEITDFILKYEQPEGANVTVSKIMGTGNIVNLPNNSIIYLGDTIKIALTLDSGYQSAGYLIINSERVYGNEWVVSGDVKITPIVFKIGYPYSLNIDSNSNMVVYRTGSHVDSASIGELHNGDVVYGGDDVNITDSCKGYRLQITVNGFEITGADDSNVDYDFVITGDTTIQSSMIKHNSNWESAEMPTNRWWKSLTYGNGKFVAVATMSNIVAISSNGEDWIEYELPISATWEKIIYGNGMYVIIGQSNTVLHSTDGINWQQSTMPNSAGLDTWRYIAYGNNTFVAKDDFNKIIAYSTDGINWQQSNSEYSKYINFGGMTFGDRWCISI